MNKSLLSIGILSLSFLIFSCTTNQDLASETSDLAEKEIFKAPLANLRTEAEYISFENVENGGKVRLSEMTELEIPQNAFVHADGTPVTGKVQFKYREFKDAIDVILNDIPMEYDSAGVKNVFQTAGMFELNGFQKDKPIFIKDGNSLKVEMTSNVTDGNYNEYVLDTITGEWTYIMPTPPLNSGDNTEDAELENEYPIGPTAYDPNGHIVDLKIDVNDYPELVDLKGLMWQYAGEDVQKDLVNNKYIYKEVWRDMELLPEDREKSIFRLSLKNRFKSFSLLVRPVLAGKSFDKAYENFRARKEAYLLQEKNRRDSIAKNREIVSRILVIQRFGFYNCDQLFAISAPLIVDVSIKTENLEFDNDEDAIVYLVTGFRRTVYKFKKSELNNISFSTQIDNAFVAILPDNKVAVFSGSDFRNIDVNKAKAYGRLDITLNTIPEEIASADQVRALIGG